MIAVRGGHSTTIAASAARIGPHRRLIPTATIALDRGTHGEVGDHPGPAHQEAQGARRGHADDQHPAALAHAEHDEGHARRGEQGAPEREQPPEHHQTQGQVGEHGRLGQLDGGHRPSPAWTGPWLLTGPLRFGNSFTTGSGSR